MPAARNVITRAWLGARRFGRRLPASNRISIDYRAPRDENLGRPGHPAEI